VQLSALAALTALTVGLAACGTPGGGGADAAADAPATVDAGRDAAAAPDAAGSMVCDQETRDDDYVAGMSHTDTGDNGWQVILLSSDPGPPARGDNAWTVQVVDDQEIARDDIDIAVFPFMPDHGHGTPVTAEVTPSGTDGVYAIDPINLYMPGFWVVRLTLLDQGTGAELDRVLYRFCVEL
jgi:hypothetical protein